MPNNDFQILIQAIVDAKDVQSRLDAIKDLSIKIEKVNLDQSAIDSLRNQLTKNGIDVNLVLGNVNQVQSQAIKTGQQIGKKIQSGINSVIQKGNFQKVFSNVAGDINSTGKEAEKYFQTLSNSVSIQEKLGKNNNLESFIVSLKNADGVAEQLRYTLKQIEDNNGNITNRWFEYSGGSINDNGVIKQFKAINSAADGLQIRIEKLKANYSDLNAPKAIKDSEHLSSLDQQYKKVLQSISNLRSADDSTFSSMQTNVKSEITALENMISQFRNAENVSSKLKGTDLSSGISIAKNDLEKFKADSKDFPQITKTIQDLNAAIAKVGDAASLNKFTDQLRIARSELAKIKSETSATNRDEKVGINVSGLVSKISDIQRISPQIDKFKAQINGAEVSVQSLLDDLTKVNTQSDFSVINSKFKAFTDSAKAAGIAISEVSMSSNKLTEIQLSIDTEKYSTQIFSLQEQLKKFNSQSGEVFQNAQSSLTQLKTAYENMKSSSGDERIKYEKEYQKHLETTRNLLKQVSSQKGNELIPQTDSRRLNFIKQLNDYLSKNTAMTKRSQDEIKSWIATLSSVDDMTRSDLENLKASFQNLDTQLRNTGKLGLSWADKFKQAVSKFGGWAVATGSVMELWSWVRRIPEEVYKIDTAMTNLYKVTDETNRKYENFLDNVSDKAQEIGRSISSLVDQTANWAKLGFGIDEASKLAEISSIYANVGEVDDSTAVADLVTAMKSFNIEASDSITIVDSLNKLGNEFASDAKSLGEGLRTSASALNLAGNDINQTLAMLTGGTEITQNASEMGNALKVLSMRLRGMKGELEALGEEYENVESISKIQTQILNRTDGAVNIFDDKNGDFRSTYEILKDISKVWTEISKTDQAELLEIMAGKQRGNQVSALIKAFQSGQVEKAYAASLNAAGSAMQEQERWMNSLEAKVQQLEAAFQSLSSTVLDSDFLKVLAEGTTSVVNSLDSIIDRFGLLTPLLAGGGIAAFIKNFDWPCNKGYCLDF